MTDDAIEFRGLGTVEVLVAGRRLPLAGAKQRGLLALLMSNVPRVVSLQRIADDLWPERRPDTGTVYRLASRLRHILAAGGDRPESDRPILLGGEGGYRLDVRPELIDIHRFESLLRAGRAELSAGQPQEAFRTLRLALEQWRGPAFTGTPDAVRIGPGNRLEELRMVAFEERAVAALCCGKQAEVLPDLAERASAGPIRERLVALLMIALQQSGRCAEALDLYRVVRERMLAEQAMEPGEQLREVHCRLLRGETAPVPSASGTSTSTARPILVRPAS